MPRFSPAPAALALAEAWRTGEFLAALPAPPGTARQAAAVLAALLTELDLPAVGFRALPDGTTGPLLESRLFASGTTLPASALPHATARAAVLFRLARALPASATPYTARRVLGALGSAQAAIDLGAWRTQAEPAALPARLADLGGLGAVVLATPPRAGAAAPDPAALRLAWNGGKLQALDARPLLLAAAEAARLAGGLPAGAALLAAGLVPPMVLAPGESVSCRIVGLGTAAAALA
jgi:2-keto-4-pentenoate hydratase